MVLYKNFLIDVNIFYIKSYNILFLKSDVSFCYLYLGNFFFFKYFDDLLILMFLNKKFYNSFIKIFAFFFSIISKIFYFKLKLKGLGYRIKHVTKFLFKFFLAKNHFFYFFVPYNIFIKHRRRHLYVLSVNKFVLNDLFSKLLLLKKMDFYRKSNSFFLKKKLLFLKKKK